MLQKKSLNFLAGIVLLLCNLQVQAGNNNFRQKDTTKVPTLIIMFDGLRPDYITPQLMPRLYEMRNKGAYGSQHHSVYPTVTRVNAASYATGAYPVMHGLMENSMYLPGLDDSKTFNTGNAQQLIEIESKTGGKLLTIPSLGEILDASGEQLFVYSSGTTGQAFLQNHKVKGAIINPDLILPESIKEKLLNEVGSIPPSATPNTARHRWVTDALLHYSIKKDGPLVSAIWLSDPDGTAHKHGIGLPITNEALEAVDTQFGRILDSIKSRGLQFNVLISADHGFISYSGSPELTDFLIEKKLKQSKTSDDVVVAGSSIYVKDRNPAVIKAIVENLQQQEWAGAIFTRAEKPGSDKGMIKGTLSFDAINWNHDQRAGDIVVAENWNDNVNAYGYAGMATTNGPAGHGGSSKYEMHIALIAFGPSFKPAFQSSLPTSNVDLIPTILSLYQLPVPQTMQGRVLDELFEKGNFQSSKNTPKSKALTASAKAGNKTYTVTLDLTEYKGYRYINYIKASR